MTVEQGKIWDDIATERSQQLTRFARPLWDALLDAARVWPGVKFLDAGCGNGGASELAAERRADVVGADGSPEMIALARQRVPSGEFHVADFEKLPFENATFDAIVACNSVHFSGSIVGGLRELGRVCKPGGRISVQCPNHLDEWHLNQIFAAVYNLTWPRRPTDLFRAGGPGVLERTFEDAGLTLVGKQKMFQQWRFPDLDAAYGVIRILGSVAAVIGEIGEERVRTELHRVLRGFERAKGEIRIEGWLTYYTASPAAAGKGAA